MRPAKPGDRCVVINDMIPANVGKQVHCDAQCDCKADAWACTNLEPAYSTLLTSLVKLPAGCKLCFRKKDIVPLEDPDAEAKQAAKSRPAFKAFGTGPQPATSGWPFKA